MWYLDICKRDEEAGVFISTGPFKTAAEAHLWFRNEVDADIYFCSMHPLFPPEESVEILKP